jgi:hypothetical protein
VSHDSSLPRTLDSYRVEDVVLPEEALFLSFWNIGLENIPEGALLHRLLAPADAKAAIDAARASGNLRCASDEELFAPELEHERLQHEELCRVLTRHYGIALTLDDFCDEDEIDGDRVSILRPLVLADFEAPHRLLVVDCSYVPVRRESTRPLQLDLDPESVTFHLFETLPSSVIDGR